MRMSQEIQPATAADIVIIGSGIGGATMAAGLAASGADILILEAGDHLPDRPENRDPRAIFQRGFFRPMENWYDETGSAFNPGNYYNVGGNSKFYGAVLTRYRSEDFEEMQHLEGVSPAWPFPYEELEPWYGKAEALFQVRGKLGEDPTEPLHSTPYDFPAGSRRSAHRCLAGAAEDGGCPPIHPAARCRYRCVAVARQNTMGCASKQFQRQDGCRDHSSGICAQI